MKPLGDPHNFGKRVALTDDGLISKPRSLFWEWLFLSSKSPFRRFIEEKAQATGANSPFRLIPVLQFSSPSLLKGGTVTCLKLSPFSEKDLSPELCEGVGAVVGLFTVMGVADLHFENIAFGMDSKGAPIFSPLDIESGLETYTLPAQTHLLPSAEMPEHLCGVSAFLKLFSENSTAHSKQLIATALASGYLKTIKLVLDHSEGISEVLSSLTDFGNTPTRLFLRSTRQYYSWKDNPGQPQSPEFRDSELTQLKRGDIPYFVRKLASTEVLCFAEGGSLVPANLSDDFTRRGLSNSLCFPLGQVTPLFSDPIQRSRLIKAGALQLIRYCDDGNSTGRFQHGDLSCEFTESEILMNWQDQVKVKCSRD